MKHYLAQAAVALTVGTFMTWAVNTYLDAPIRYGVCYYVTGSCR